MSDRIKKIKIKQSDGTFSDYIPIGADAKNIDTTRGESVQSVIDKTARYYNSIAEMKLDDNIQVGDTCVTLGYYEVNDGGSGTYKIVDNESLIDDGGSVHTLDNGLKAQLVIKDSVNVKQFGAYGNGEYDDTNAIRNTINYIDNLINKDTIFMKQTSIIITSGKYKITSQIIVPGYLSIKGIGNVVFLSYIDEGSTIWIKPTKKISKESGVPYYISKEDYKQDALLDSIVIYYAGELDYSNANANHIAIEVGDDNNTYDNISRIKINNISCLNFHVGLLLNNINTYILTFTRCHIEHNYIDVMYGKTSGESASNSGENILFDNCVIAGAVYAVYINTRDSASNTFKDCSFDFNGCVFYFNTYSTTNINVFSGQIEAVGYYNPYIQNISETEGFGTVAYFSPSPSQPNSYSSIMFFGTWFMFRDNSDYLTYKFLSNAKDCLAVSFNSIRILETGRGCELENLFLCNENINIISNNFTFIGDHNTSRNVSLISQRLEAYTVDNIDNLTTENYDIKTGYKLVGGSPWSVDEDGTGIISNKSLICTKSGTSTETAIYRKINTEGKRYLLINPVIKSNIMTSLWIHIGYNFYDKNDNLLSSRINNTDDTVKYNNSKNNEYNKASSCYPIEIPSQTDYCRVYLYIRTKDNSSFGDGYEIRLDGIHYNLID